MEMGKVVKITASNVDLCERATASLRDHLETLVQKTERYPVECTFDVYRFVFTSRLDITNLIEALDAKIKAYRALSSSPLASAS